VGNGEPRFVTAGEGDQEDGIGPEEGIGPEGISPEDGISPDNGSDPEEFVARFRATPGGATARFARAQAAILRDLVGQVAELIGDDTADAAAGPDVGGIHGDAADLDAELGLSGSAELPADPVLARLLPDAYRDDPEASGEFRRYTEHGLRSGKVAAAATVLATLPAAGGRVRLSEPEAQAWLRALNDVRLALGVRLGVTEDFDADVARLRPDDSRTAYVWVYRWLALLQESLVDALS
jgi:Domain of unknown function (DUF2017)